jgi:hypothetical protein
MDWNDPVVEFCITDPSHIIREESPLPLPESPPRAREALLPLLISTRYFQFGGSTDIGKLYEFSEGGLLR